MPKLLEMVSQYRGLLKRKADGRLTPRDRIRLESLTSSLRDRFQQQPPCSVVPISREPVEAFGGKAAPFPYETDQDSSDPASPSPRTVDTPSPSWEQAIRGSRREVPAWRKEELEREEAGRTEDRIRSARRAARTGSAGTGRSGGEE